MRETILFKGIKMDDNKRILTWIWPGRIPCGYVTVLAAEGGIGKSGLALYLANKFAGEGRNVVFVDAERCSTHIQTRKENWNLPHLDDVYFTGETLPDGDVVTGTAPTIVDLVNLLSKIKPDVVFLDSLTSLGKEYDLKGTNNIANFYSALENLTGFNNVAVIIIAHLRKPAQNETSELLNQNISGSAAIVNLARSVMMMQKSTVVENTIILRHTKCNMAKLALDLYIQVDPITGEFKNFEEKIQAKQILAGTKIGTIRETALDLIAQNKTKKEIIIELKKNLHATNTELSRLWAWLKAKKNFDL